MSLSTKVVLTDPVPSGGTFAAPFPTDYYPGIFIRAAGHQLADEAGSVYGGVSVDVQANNLVLTNDGDTTIRAGSYTLSLSAVTRGEMLKAARVIEAAFGYDVFDQNGDPVLRGLFIPRTGTLASLETLAGEVGEIGAATDGPELVKFNGVPGQAVAYAPYGPTLTIISQAEQTYTIDPNKYSSILIDNSVGAFGAIFRIAPGRKDGQQLSIYQRGGTSTLFPEGYGGAAAIGASVPQDGVVNLVWADGAWRGAGSAKVAFGVDDSNPPYVAGVLASASATNSMAIGNGTTSGSVGAIAIGASAGSGSDQYPFSTSIGAGAIPLVASFAHFAGNPQRKNGIAIGTLIGETIGASTASLTVDGQPVSLWQLEAPGTFNNVIKLDLVAFLAEVSVFVFGRDEDGNCVCYRRMLLISEVGGVATIANQQTIGADYESAALASAGVAISIDAVDGYLDIKVTGVAAKTMAWCAKVTIGLVL